MRLRMAPTALVAVFLVVVAPIAFGASPEAAAVKLDPNLPYQAKKLNPVTYDVDFAVVVTPPYHAQVLKVWLPLPQSDAGQEVQEIELTTFPTTVKPKVGREPRFGNRFAFFEFAQPQGGQIIRHRFKVKVWELRWEVDPAKVASIANWPESFARYLRSEQRAVVVSDPVRKIVQEILPEKRGPAEDLATVLHWVNGHIEYDHAGASLQASSEHALAKRRGHCSDYHGLCAAFGRALGYPTRITYGINPFPKNSPSHCKLEVFLPPYGWVSFDVSETQRLMKSLQKNDSLDDPKKQMLIRAAEQRLLRGFRDNTWFLQTKGTDYDLEPPTSNRVAVVRTIYAEADGVALPEPDPANPQKREFSWMTVHQYKPDKSVRYPFEDWKSLLDQQQVELKETAP